MINSLMKDILRIKSHRLISQLKNMSFELSQLILKQLICDIIPSTRDL